MEKLKKIIVTFLLILIAILICCGTIENGILLTILSFIIIYFFVKKVKIKKFGIFLVVFCLATKIIAALVLNIPAVADYWIMFDASTRLLEGDLTFIQSSYFTQWGYQLFHVFYQALMLKIIDSVIFLKILNCIYSTVTTIIIYLILKKTTSEKTARITTLLYAISIYPIYINSVLGNQQLALMLIMIASYILFFKKHNWKNLILIGLLLGLSNLERSEGIIYILTIIIYFIITNKKFKETLKKCALVLISFLLITQIPSYIMIKTGINEIGFGNANPEWKFLLGFNHDYYGKNNTEDEIYLNDIEAEKEEIINRITDYKKLPNLFYQKIKIQWLYGDLEDAFHVNSTEQFSKEFMIIFINYIKIINLAIISLVFYGLYKNKKIDKVYYFFIINVIIYFGVYLLIEVNARYYYNPQVSIIILAALGIDKIINRYEKTKKIVEK